ncbi:MAG TPA: AI-2E family transporter [Polyangiaceae bacterium]
MADVKLGAGAFFLLAAAVIVAAGLKAAGGMIVPLLVAACIAAAMAPIVHWLKRFRLPTYAAVTLTILFSLAVLVGFGALLAVAASDLTESVPRLERAIVDVKQDMAAWLAQNRMARFAPMVMNFDAGKLSEGIVTGVLLGVPDALSLFGVVLFVVIFLLLEAATFHAKLQHALHWRPEHLGDVQNTIHEVQKYMLVKSWISAAMGILCGVWCAVMNLDNAVLWGVVTFAFNFVPVFGPILATIGPVVTAFLQLGTMPAVGLLAGLLLVHNVLGNIVEPKVLGRALGLSPLVITLAMVIWGWLLGPVGALLSVPLTMVVKIVFANTEDLRWIAVLLGPGEGREEQEYAEERRKTRLSRVPSAAGLPPVDRGSLPV